MQKPQTRGLFSDDEDAQVKLANINGRKIIKLIFISGF